MTIKKSKVAKIQICEIIFNRTRASLQKVLSPSKVPGSTPGTTTKQPAFSRDISMGVTLGGAGGTENISKFNDSANRMLSSGPISCFVIENESFIEVRDCCIKSVKDKSNFDFELDNYLSASQRD